MARTTTLICDCCGNPTEQIVGKLIFVPMIPGVSRSAHSNYSHHADIGVCCKNQVLQGIRFRKRTTAEEYQASRRGEKVA